MPFTTTCPHCHGGMMIPDELAGQTSRCPRCGKGFQVPVVAQPEFEPSPRYRQQSRGVSPVLIGVIIGVLLAGGAGAVWWFGVREKALPEKPSPGPDVVQAKGSGSEVKGAKGGDVRPKVEATKREPKVEVVPKVEVKPVSDNAEWERKSRAKLKEGLELLKAKRTAEASHAILYAMSDKPNNLTDAQKEMMLEIYERRSIIAVVEEDRDTAKKTLELVSYMRKDLGWDIDKYEAWAKVIFNDTCERMGVPSKK